MLQDDAAKMRFNYYQHFVRGDRWVAPPGRRAGGNLPARSGGRVRVWSAPARGRRGCAASPAPALALAPRKPSGPRPPGRPGRPATAGGGAAAAPAAAEPAAAAPAAPAPAAPAAAPTGPPARPRSASLAARPARAASAGAAGRPPSGRAPGRAAAAAGGARPTSAPPCGAQGWRGRRPSTPHAGGGAPAPGRPGPEPAEGAGQLNQFGKPPFGSIYYPCVERMRTPGPGHYLEEQQPHDIGFPQEPHRSHAWARFGHREQEQVPENLMMYNACYQALGPGKYQVDSPQTNLHSPRWSFAGMSTKRLPCRKTGAKRTLPLTCHQDPRFAHASMKEAPDGFAEADHAWAQGLAVRCARPASPRVDQHCRQGRLQFHGAAWRLGGQLLIPAGNDAGPYNVSREAQRRPRRPQQPAAVRRPAAIAGGFGSCTARRF